MRRGRGDTIALVLAIAGAIGAISLAGIFLTYLFDTLGDDDGAASEQAVSRGPTGAAGTTARPGAGGTAAPSEGESSGEGAEAGTTGNVPRQNRIPDNQQYETFRNSSANYSILYPTGWDRQGSGRDVKFVSNRNTERIIVGRGTEPTVRTVRRDLRKRKGIRIVSNPSLVNLNGNRVIKTTLQVLGVKQEAGTPVRLLVDQYRFSQGRSVATLELVTTGAVQKDNSDDYARIARSFRWL